MNSQWELINMHEQQYIACAAEQGAAAQRQRERWALPGTEGEHGGSEQDQSRIRAGSLCGTPGESPGAAGVQPARLGVPGLSACLWRETAGAALLNREDYFCRLFKHGMQFVHSTEARRTVQVTVWSLSGKELDFISKNRWSLLGLWPLLTTGKLECQKLLIQVEMKEGLPYLICAW